MSSPLLLPLLLAVALAQAPAPWPAGARAEAYLAAHAGLHRTQTLPAQAAVTQLRSLRPAQAPPATATALGLHYAAPHSTWGELAVYAYSFARPSALDSAFALLRLPAAGALARSQQRPTAQGLYVIRSQDYLLVFDGSRLTRDAAEWTAVADIYADLLDDVER